MSTSSASLDFCSCCSLARTSGAVPLSGGTRCSLTSAFWITEPNFSMPAFGTMTMTFTGSVPAE